MGEHPARGIVMTVTTSYCGPPLVPGEVLARFNLDPVAIGALVALALLQLHALRSASGGRRALAAGGWAVAGAAFFSPLCALSVALFSARVGQHMILVLVAAPLIAAGWPRRSGFSARRLAIDTACFGLALWFWHMPAPYAGTFRSDALYWTMHVTLFGSAVLLWRDLIHHEAEHAFAPVAAGLLTSVHMGLLGAVLTFAGVPLFAQHLATAPLWGMSAMTDQQLGGLLMWVPGIALFIGAARASLTLAMAPARH